MTWKNSDMPNISLFLEGCKADSIAQISQQWNLMQDTMHMHASKQLEVVSWYHTNDDSVHLPDPIAGFTYLSDTNAVMIY